MDEFDVDLDLDFDCDFDFDCDLEEIDEDDWTDGLGGELVDEIISGESREFETSVEDFARITRRQAKRKAFAANRQENLRNVLTSLPEPGESFHILGCNKFDAWDWIPRVVELFGGRADEFLLNTWIISGFHTREFVEMMASGKLGAITIMTGLLFKGREPAAYAILVEKLAKYGGRYLALKSHAKIALLKNTERDDFIVIETSANCSLNEKVEQTAVHNDRHLYEWYRDWFDEMFEKSRQRQALW